MTKDEENEMTQINVPIQKSLLKKFDETWPKVFPFLIEKQGRSAAIRILIQRFLEKEAS